MRSAWSWPPRLVWGAATLCLLAAAVAGILAGPRLPVAPLGPGGWAAAAAAALFFAAGRVSLTVEPPVSLSFDTLGLAFLTPLLGWPRALACLLAALAVAKAGNWLTAQPTRLPAWLDRLWTELGAPPPGPARDAWRARWRRPRPLLFWQPLLGAGWGVTAAAGIWAAARAAGALRLWPLTPAVTLAAWTVAEAALYVVLLLAVAPADRRRYWAGGTWRAVWRAGALWAALLPPVGAWLVPRFGWGAALVPAVLLWHWSRALAAEQAVASATAARRTAEAEASHDPLTGLPNRRAWDAYLARVAAAGLPAVVAIADADHFKRVNDTYGHAAGDAVLQALAQRLQRACRTDRGPWPDLVARLGGEEFGLLLPQMPREVAPGRVEAIRQAACGSVVFDAATIPVTLSLGAHWSGDPADLAGALAQADRALYAAKSRGRNQTAWEPALLVPPPSTPAVPPAARRLS